jgi:hypothetical protein
MPFGYYRRLSAARQRIYRQSDEIKRLDLPAGVIVGGTVARLRERLAADDRAGVQKVSQALVDSLASAFHVPPIQIRVLACRPTNKGGELYGLYRSDPGSAARISVWMRTAAKKRVVAFKTFLRTLVHEVCHHLDYELFKLAETFHTEGFYSRESSLASALLAQSGSEERAEPPAADPQPRLF